MLTEDRQCLLLRYDVNYRHALHTSVIPPLIIWLLIHWTFGESCRCGVVVMEHTQVIHTIEQWDGKTQVPKGQGKPSSREQSGWTCYSSWEPWNQTFDNGGMVTSWLTPLTLKLQQFVWFWDIWCEVFYKYFYFHKICPIEIKSNSWQFPEKTTPKKMHKRSTENLSTPFTLFQDTIASEKLWNFYFKGENYVMFL